MSADFRAFVASLAGTAAATLHHVEGLLDPAKRPAGAEGAKAQGAKSDPAEQIRTGLAASQQLIDTLAMLEQKTQGNLNADEAQFLQTALAELRISYVRVLDRSRAAPKA